MRAGHRARNIAIGTDGALYVNVGSQTNSCQKKDRTAESPGNDPCTELETRAGIWRFDANKAGPELLARRAVRHRHPQRRWASTVRPDDGALFATQHGRDQLHDNWPKVFPTTTQYQANNPGEELLQVSQGDDFGWPYCYYSMEEKKLVTAPEYGGDGKKTDRCEGKKRRRRRLPWALGADVACCSTRAPSSREVSRRRVHRLPRFVEPRAGAAGRLPRGLPADGGRSTSGEFETFADGFAALPPERSSPARRSIVPSGWRRAPTARSTSRTTWAGGCIRITYGSAPAAQ